MEGSGLEGNVEHGKRKRGIISLVQFLRRWEWMGPKAQVEGLALAWRGTDGRGERLGGAVHPHLSR